MFADRGARGARSADIPGQYLHPAGRFSIRNCHRGGVCAVVPCHLTANRVAYVKLYHAGVVTICSNHNRAERAV